VTRLFTLLKPTETELERLARRETDPRFYGEFEPLTRGPFYTLLVLFLVSVCAIVAIPWRLTMRVIGVRG
jgi:hypothetical protein